MAAMRGPALLRRQAAHVSAHAGQVPAAFADRIELAQHRKAAEYTLAQIQARLQIGNSPLSRENLRRIAGCEKP